jgi:hypothetical protein
MAVVTKSVIFCDITAYSPVKFNRRFRETHRLHLQGRISPEWYQRESRWQDEWLSSWYLARLIRPWRWRPYVPPKRSTLQFALQLASWLSQIPINACHEYQTATNLASRMWLCTYSSSARKTLIPYMSGSTSRKCCGTSSVARLLRFRAEHNITVRLELSAVRPKWSNKVNCMTTPVTVRFSPRVLPYRFCWWAMRSHCSNSFWRLNLIINGKVKLSLCLTN